MKAAMGESNRTIVTIVLIAVVLGAGTLIVTKMVNSTKNNKSILCAESGGTWNGTDCIGPSGNKCVEVFYESTTGGSNCVSRSNCVTTQSCHWDWGKGMVCTNGESSCTDASYWCTKLSC